jgi:hypothetical protein
VGREESRVVPGEAAVDLERPGPIASWVFGRR